jgi:hypothetical protein
LRVAASVLVDHAGKQVRLPLVNVSATGALISVEAKEPKFRVGALLFLTLVANEDRKRKVDVNARVVRQAEDGTAVDWSDDEKMVDAVVELLRATGGTAA